MHAKNQSQIANGDLPKRPGLVLEAIGWYGAVAIVSAYALVSFGLIAAEDTVFQLLNLTGAVSIVAISWAKKVHQSVALNAFWALIAAVALIRLLLV